MSTKRKGEPIGAIKAQDAKRIRLLEKPKSLEKPVKPVVHAEKPKDKPKQDKSNEKPQATPKEKPTENETEEGDEDESLDDDTILFHDTQDKEYCSKIKLDFKSDRILVNTNHSAHEIVVGQNTQLTFTADRHSFTQECKAVLGEQLPSTPSPVKTPSPTTPTTKTTTTTTTFLSTKQFVAGAPPNPKPPPITMSSSGSFQRVPLPWLLEKSAPLHNSKELPPQSSTQEVAYEEEFSQRHQADEVCLVLEDNVDAHPPNNQLSQLLDSISHVSSTPNPFALSQCGAPQPSQEQVFNRQEKHTQQNRHNPFDAYFPPASEELEVEQVLNLVDSPSRRTDDTPFDRTGTKPNFRAKKQGNYQNRRPKEYNLENLWGLPEVVRQIFARRGITKFYDWQIQCLSLQELLSGDRKSVV